ncbi:hypothetical protein AMTRI_Chr10g227110 [Amborella trichopoda]
MSKSKRGATLPERTARAHIFTAGALSQNARALWVRQMTTGAHIGLELSECRSIVGQTKHCRSSHWDCRSLSLLWETGERSRVKRNKGTLILFHVTFELGGFCEER